MALADFDELRALTEKPHQTVHALKATSVAINQAMLWSSQFIANAALSFWPPVINPASGAPTTSVACDNTTAGAIRKSNAGAGRQIMVGGMYCARGSATNRPQMFSRPVLIADRLVQHGGLSMNTNSTQTTNLPTAALTRYTSAVGVMAAFEIYTAPGGLGPATFTVSYTNEAGTSGRTSPIVTIPSGAANSGANQFFQIPLAQGDLGFKSVESFTLSAALGTAGKSGITLFKPLCIISPIRGEYFDFLDMTGWNEEVLDDACLMMLPPSPAASGELFSLALNLAEC